MTNIIGRRIRNYRPKDKEQVRQKAVDAIRSWWVEEEERRRQERADAGPEDE